MGREGRWRIPLERNGADYLQVQVTWPQSSCKECGAVEGPSPNQGMKDGQRLHGPLDRPLSLTTVPPMVLS